ncbi:Uncharacterized conserved protein, DUF305 family [Micromonospora sediminicola]|uniref:Uncharacterized conserved protein, DUF305 family n=1 Tax=Micromonospora sediminicola TaxID=946078 RepID=A0A1A9B6M9_9ACTN|nr:MULTISPECIES: DUF305 domain-containing protein [Micromonospora]PGH42534.1 DUF305 domain-containing protein [Micromonospora sp. WMMA1996]SBT64654.1 Uncharacterized conserved protein, DUF305 family [Micromonospora sediminicola]
MTAPVTTDSELDEAPATDEGGRPAVRRYGLLAVAAAIVVGLLLGYAGGLLTPTLTRPGDNSAEAGFARDMTAHHNQAVAMGLLAFRQGQDAEVRQVGVDIATGQQGEIGTMQTWLRSWKLDPTGDQPAMAWMPDGAGLVKNGLMPGMATPEEMAKLKAATGREFDLLFLNMMIRHHIGGVHMIDGILAEGHDDDVLAVAQTMKNTQQNDLTNLSAALKRLGGTP